MITGIKNRKVLYILLIAWLLILLKLTLFKNSLPFIYNHFHDNFNHGLLKRSFKRAHLIPFFTLRDLLFYEPNRAFAYRNLLGNILMFIPAGFVLPPLFNPLNNTWKFFLSCLFISLALEILQLFTGLGDFDVDDLLLNIIGGLAGFAIYRLLQRKGGNQAELSKGNHQL